MARQLVSKALAFGDPFANAEGGVFTVYIAGVGSTLAQIYNEKTGGTFKNNPFTVGADSLAEFYINPGIYRFEFLPPGEVTPVVIDEYLVLDENLANAPTGGQVDSVVAGAGVNVDSSDPVNPVVTSRIEPATTSASYALTASNENQIMEITGSGTVNITIPVDSTTDLPIGFSHIVRPANAFSGTATWVAESGSVTVSSPASGTLVAPAGEASAAIKMAANSWVIVGVTVAV